MYYDCAMGTLRECASDRIWNMDSIGMHLLLSFLALIQAFSGSSKSPYQKIQKGFCSQTRVRLIWPQNINLNYSHLITWPTQLRMSLSSLPGECLSFRRVISIKLSWIWWLFGMVTPPTFQNVINEMPRKENAIVRYVQYTVNFFAMSKLKVNRTSV